MKIKKHFPGDTDSTLQKIQERLFPDCVELLYTRPREKYLADVESTHRDRGELFDLVEDKLYRAVKDKSSIDHDLLLPAYDRIAASFRLDNTDFWQTSLFAPDNGNGNQSASQIEQLKNDWIEFYRGECELIAESDELARAVLNAVGFAGQDRGEDALQALLWLLDKRYKSLTRARDRWGEFREMREFCDW